MALIEGLFAGFGAVAFVYFVLMRHERQTSAPPPPGEDPALPYREAMAAALRIDQAAIDAEEELEAARTASEAATQGGSRR